MEFEIVSAGFEDGTELLALRTWLRDDPELRDVRVSVVEAEPVPGTMGGIIEALHVTLSDVAALTGIATSISTWLSTRPRSRTRTVRSGEHTGELSGTADAAEVRTAIELAGAVAGEAGEERP
ncbi:hypothetical protein [Streptomyces sp. NPDC004284]|uniref:effector-associated constant component EACC1 n=1 Tax=Streptomyces sp. NPDC004284 TaxID=3364695 RepID=UPI0036770EC9